MTVARRKNWALFQSLFKGDNRFIIQRENGKSSAFSFTIVLNPEAELSRPKIMEALRQADVAAIMQINGIGRRTAESVVAALATERAKVGVAINTSTGEVLEGDHPR